MTGRRVGLAGGAAVVIGLLQLVQANQDALNLRQPILWLASLLIGVAGLIVDRRTQTTALRRTQRDTDVAMDAALASWPPQRVADADLYDVGVHPPLGGPTGDHYVPRDGDGRLRDAVAEGGVVLIVGPARSGKSRSAFEALTEALPEAGLLIPEHGARLDDLFGHPTEELLPGFGAGVVWLDGLERFLPSVDVDCLVKLTEPEAGAPPVVVIATMDAAAFEQTLGGAGEESLALRRFAAAGHGVILAGELTDAERERFAELLGRSGDTVAELFAADWSGGWPRRPARRGTPPVPRRPIDRPLAALSLLAALVAIAGAVSMIRSGVTAPPPLGTQLDDIARSARPCERLTAFPERGEGLQEGLDPTARTLVAAVSRIDCGESDELRFYRVRDGRLRRVAGFSPEASGSPQSFACIGALQDPCHVPLQGRSSVVAGAFVDAGSHQELPFLAAITPKGRVLLQALTPGTAGSRADDGPPPMVLRFAASGAGRPSRASPAACAQGVGCLQAPATLTSAVVPANRSHPPLLLLGTRAAGLVEAPTAIRVRAYTLVFDGRRLELGERCDILVAGRRRERIAIASAEAARGALLAGWSPAGAEVLC